MMENDEWMPIETAPVDVPVRLGGYRAYGVGQTYWVTDIGLAWETQPFMLFFKRVRPQYRDIHTHWMPLPEPPKAK